MKSVNAHNFAHIPTIDIPRSAFHSPFGLKTAFDSGYLIPLFWKHILPGDSWKLEGNFFGRLSTPIVPFLDNLKLSIFYFYIPNRLLWSNWEHFCGAQDNPGDQTDFIVPQIESPASGFEFESIFDFLGLPPGVKIKEMSLPLRAYNLVWNEWFRTTYLQDMVPVPTGDGPDNPNDFKLLRRGKRHDFWTSSLPTPQRGPGVELPLTGNAPIRGTIPPTGLYCETSESKISQRHVFATGWNQSSEFGNQVITSPHGNTQGFKIVTESRDPSTSLYADLSQVTSATILSLRQAFQLQKLLERDNLGGYGRFTEILYSHFGVISPDARLQRPEYLGGQNIPIVINSVAQTSASSSTSPQGNLAAIGTMSGSGLGFRKSFVEHGILLCLASVNADLNYQQGIDPAWSYRRRFDWYWPSLAHIGEQAVLLKSIYAQGTEADETVFGYQERYSELRYNNNLITGKLRSTCPTSLDIWHLAQKFDNAPALNAEFIEDRPPLKRVLAVQDEPEFLLDCYFDVNAIRPMPTYGTPGLVDHF